MATKSKIYICVECEEDCIWHVMDAKTCKILPDETSKMNQSDVKTPLQSGSAVLGHSIYVIGGLCEQKHNVKIYDTKKRKWKFGTSMGVKRHSPLVVPVRSYNKLFVFGGTLTRKKQSWIQCYDIVKDKWEVLESPSNHENLILTGHIVSGDTLVLWNQDLFYTFNVETKQWRYRLELKHHLPTIHRHGNIFVGGIVPRVVRLGDILFWFNGAELLNHDFTGQDNTLDSLIYPVRANAIFQTHFKSLTPHFWVVEKKLEDNTLDSSVSPEEAETLYGSYFRSLASYFLVSCSEEKRLFLFWCNTKSEPQNRVSFSTFPLTRMPNSGPFHIKSVQLTSFHTVPGAKKICHCLTMQQPSEASSNDKSGLRDEIDCEDLLVNLSRGMYIKNYLSLSRYKDCEADSAATPISRPRRKVAISISSLMQGLGLDEKYEYMLHKIIDKHVLYHLNEDDIKALNIPVSHKPARCTEERTEGDSDTEKNASDEMIHEKFAISSAMASFIAPNLREIREEPVLGTTEDIKHRNDKARSMTREIEPRCDKAMREEPVTGTTEDIKHHHDKSRLMTRESKICRDKGMQEEPVLGTTEDIMHRDDKVRSMAREIEHQNRGKAWPMTREIKPRRGEAWPMIGEIKPRRGEAWPMIGEIKPRRGKAVWEEPIFGTTECSMHRDYKVRSMAREIERQNRGKARSI